MDMTPQRQQIIDAHVAETRVLMAGYAFELNDLVRFALSAAKGRTHRIYHPMDPVNDCIRDWDGLNRKLGKLARAVASTAERLGVQPFDAEQPAGDEPPSSR